MKRYMIEIKSSVYINLFKFDLRLPLLNIGVFCNSDSLIGGCLSNLLHEHISSAKIFL